jgi:predicted RNA methylase
MGKKDFSLEAALQQLKPFDTNQIKFELEQYATSAELGAAIITHIQDDVLDKRVLDLGCGTGMLSCACALAGASIVVGVDCDEDALALARTNVQECDVDHVVDFVRCRIDDNAQLPLRNAFDTCVMNPPFGTRKKGIDAAFLRAALSLCDVVYSLHKTSTRAFLLKRAHEWGAVADVVAELRFDLPKTYAFHADDSRDVAVDLVRFRRVDGADAPPPPVVSMAEPPPPATRWAPRGRGRAPRGRGRGRGRRR